MFKFVALCLYLIPIAFFTDAATARSGDFGFGQPGFYGQTFGGRGGFPISGAAAAPPPFSCNLSFPNDGCAGAPAPTTAIFGVRTGFNLGGYINTVSGTPTNYLANNCGGGGSAGACRPPWKVAGFDYNVGNYTSCDINNAGPGNFTNCGSSAAVCTDTTWTAGRCLLDPAILSAHSLLPSGCTYNATGNNGGPSLVCAANWPGTGLSHLNIGPVNGHSCTQFQVNRQTTNPMVIDDLYGFNDSGLCGNSQGFYFTISGTQSPSTPPVISNFYLNGNNTQFSTIYGPTTTPGICFLATPSPVRCNPREAVFGDDGTFKYFAIVNFAGDVINVAAAPQTGQSLFEYGVVSGYNVRAPNTHTEMFAGPNGNTNGSPGVIGTTFRYVVSISSTNQSTFGTAPFFVLSGFPVSTGPLIFNNNIAINQWAGGQTANSVSFAGCRGATFSAGPPASCSGSGAIFFLTSGYMGWGSSLPSSCGGGGFIGPPTGSIPTGAIGAFWIDSGGSFTGYGDLGQNNQVAANCSGTLSSVSVGDNGFLFGYGPHPAASITIDSNYIDASSWGSPTPPLYTLGQLNSSAGNVTFPTTTTMTSTVNLDGLNNDTFVQATGLCPGDVTTCPFIPTGGNYSAGTTITINPNGTTPSGTFNGAVIGEATICTTPVSYDGLNIDMSGQGTTAWFNTNTAFRNPIGC